MKGTWKPPYIGQQTVVNNATTVKNGKQVNTYGFGKDNDAWLCITVEPKHVDTELKRQAAKLREQLKEKGKEHLLDGANS